MKLCLLIPIYNHHETIERVIEELAPFDLPCMIIDDGSNEATRAKLCDVNDRHSWVHIQTRSENGGKGAALKDGYRLAHSKGFSHVIQLDADGQHAKSDVPRLAEIAAAQPTAMILIAPTFENAPRSRRYGRLVSCFFVWLECCSLAIRDPLCGFRCLPLAPLISILDRVRCGDRMDFDPEIAVRLVWDGVPVVNIPGQITYPRSGVSHFKMWRDNVLISWLHTRLLAGMIIRLPQWLARRIAVHK